MPQESAPERPRSAREAEKSPPSLWKEAPWLEISTADLFERGRAEGYRILFERLRATGTESNYVFLSVCLAQA